MNILIVEGEALFDVSTSTYDGNEVSVGRTEYLVFATREYAGKRAREYWEEMARNDKAEFRCLIGDERLIKWALNEPDSSGFCSAKDFFEAIEGLPEEELARYDGEEREGFINKTLMDELDNVSVEGEGKFLIKHLRAALAGSEFNYEILPEELRPIAEDIIDKADDPDWIKFQDAFDKAIFNGDEWATGLRDLFTFYPVVCYRTN